MIVIGNANWQAPWTLSLEAFPALRMLSQESFWRFAARALETLSESTSVSLHPYWTSHQSTSIAGLRWQPVLLMLRWGCFACGREWSTCKFRLSNGPAPVLYLSKGTSTRCTLPLSSMVSPIQFATAQVLERLFQQMVSWQTCKFLRSLHSVSVDECIFTRRCLWGWRGSVSLMLKYLFQSKLIHLSISSDQK